VRSLRALVLVGLVLSSVVSQVHRAFVPDGVARTRIRDAMTVRHTTDLDPERMRAVNPEWDFMRRTFVVLALANQALVARGDEVSAKLAQIDALIDATLRDESERGQSHFLLSYAGAKPWIDPDASSVFVDGELLAMMSAREIVRPLPRWRDESLMRAERIERAMLRSPTLSAESYPNECWTFCNTFALAALAMSDRVEGSDHRALSARWIRRAKEVLVDPRTGLLVSSFTRDGRVLDGPEGSSIWMSAHNLLVVDEAFAEDQYTRAVRELRSGFAGFGWAREWPAATESPREDVDSGFVVPLLGASSGSSGLAVLGASAFDDHAFRDELLASLELAGRPSAAHDRYGLGNPVGDAVILYALSFGPLWARTRERGR
jgi:hypothetical protein